MRRICEEMVSAPWTPKSLNQALDEIAAKILGGEEINPTVPWVRVEIDARIAKLKADRTRQVISK